MSGKRSTSGAHRLPIEHFTTHDLRRTFATTLDGMGISIELIAAIVGHEPAVNRQAKTLVRHYLRTDKLKQKRAALEAWDRRLRAILAGEENKRRAVPGDRSRETCRALTNG